jgi:hypothetical protein
MITALQTQIENHFDIKVTVKRIKSGSMRGYVVFTPRRKSKTEFPQFEHAKLGAIRAAIGSGTEPHPNFYSVQDVAIYIGNEIFNY